MTGLTDLAPSEKAILSLLLEVSSTPKAGNVDRDHDHSDLKFQHFLFSSVSAFQAFKKAEEGKSFGRCFYEAVERSVKACGRNVHFGAFMLLIPLVSAEFLSLNPSNPEKIAEKATEIVKGCGVEDSVLVLKAFRISKARVAEVERCSLKNVSENFLRKNGIKLYDWLTMGRKNVVANELISCYPASLKGFRQIKAMVEKGYSLNDAIVYAYHFLLSKYIDPLVVAKHGPEVAEAVREEARELLRDFELHKLKEFDEKLIRLKINPGSIADLTASSIYLFLCEQI